MSKAILTFLICLFSGNVFPQDAYVEKFTLDEPPSIGYFNGEIFEGSMGSGISCIHGSRDEFYMISDRGPNIYAYQIVGGIPQTMIIFPNYTSKIFRVRLEGSSIKIVQQIPINHSGVNITGIPLFNDKYIRSEIALSYSSNTELPPDDWGFDTEGIAQGIQNDFWICDEYRPAIIHLDANGTILKIYQPFPMLGTDGQLDPVLSQRLPNRGFEAITVTPQGKVYAVLQSPIGYPSTQAARTSRVHRIVMIDPSKDTVITYAYIHSEPFGKLTELDIKVGDIAAINNREFLIIEHGFLEDSRTYKIFRIDISGASLVTNERYKEGFLEKLDSAKMAASGIVPVEKFFFLDLEKLGWTPDLQKCEGITIINDSTIAVSNDNDFGLDYTDVNNLRIDEEKKTVVFKIHLTGDLKLANFIPVR